MTQVHVLIVDDDQVDRYLMKRDLKRVELEMDVAEFTGGVEALEFLKDSAGSDEDSDEAKPPRIIFLDINMPCINGLEFLDAFQDLRVSSKGLERCSVIMMSSSEHPDERRRALAHEFVIDFVTKGELSPEELGAKMEAIIAE